MERADVFACALDTGLLHVTIKRVCVFTQACCVCVVRWSSSISCLQYASLCKISGEKEMT
jgi:hypothetical protein